MELKSAVDACLKLSLKGDCSSGSHGPIGDWDVSSMTDMSCMFINARSFNGNISKWDMSSVKDMSSMFRRASSFNGDVAKWDVSRVKDMSNMFVSATSFNCDVSRWDVSKVATMEYMFRYATSFKHQLCGASWVYSKASKMNMFENSPGSIWQKKVKKPVCGPWPLPDTTLATHQYATRRPITERELIVPTPFRTSTPAITPTTDDEGACLRCGRFEKSGRFSCCAPGGAWYKNCGGLGNRNVDYKWFEGLETCKRKFKAKGMCITTG